MSVNKTRQEKNTLNIDKQDMTNAFINKDDTTYMNKFVGYLDQLANFCVRKLKINPEQREDIKQIAVEHAFKKRDKYNPSTGSAAYSYFFKVIYMRCLYELRAEKQKKSKAPQICSLEKLKNMIDEDGESDICAFNENENHYVYINGEIHDKEMLIQKVRMAKSLIKKQNLVMRHHRIYSTKTAKYFYIDDKFINLLCRSILKKRGQYVSAT